jgi:hypothetical protein
MTEKEVDLILFYFNLFFILFFQVLLIRGTF